jgi:tetratricopeptide (TPR) repeat protein
MDTSIHNALQDLGNGRATADELELLRQAFASGQIFIGGNVLNSVIIVGSGNTVQLSPEAIERLAALNYLSALHELPQPPADFVGRGKELKKILTNIEKKGGTAISGLIGMAGIGKTVLGLVVAHSLVVKYSDAQFFIDLRGTSNNPLKPIDVMRQVVQSLHPTADLRNATEEELSGAYQSSLAEKKIILFLDNAHDASQIMPLHAASNSLLVVTSRFHFTIPGLHPVELSVLNKSESIKLLKEICPRLTRKDAERIAELCGNLPIALRLAGSYLQIHVDWSVDEYIADLADKAKRLQSLHLEGADVNVIVSFEQSYQQLSDEEKHYWSMLSIFPVSFKRDALANVWNLDDGIARKLAGKLHQYSLLEYDSVTNRYRLHDLLADFASTKLTTEDKLSAQLNYFRHYRDVWHASEVLYMKGANNALQGQLLFDAEFPHIEWAYEWSIKNISTNYEVSAILKEIPDYISLARIRIHPRKQIDWFQTAVVAARELDDLSNQTKLLGNIGAAYGQLSEWNKAIEYFEKAIPIAREIGDKQREGFWSGNLGSTYGNLGDWRKGIEYFEQALKIAREFGDLRREGMWLGNIGAAYKNLGEGYKSIEYSEKALAIARKIGDKQGEGIWLNNIAFAYKNLGDQRKSIEYSEQALAIAQKIGDKQGEGIALGGIAQAYLTFGMRQKSIEYYEQAMEIASKIGDRHYEGFWLGSLGAVYSEMGEWKKSITYFGQAYEIAHEIGDLQSTSTWLGDIGEAYINLGKWQKSLGYTEQALEAARQVSDREQEGYWLCNLGVIYGNLGKINEGVDLCEQALTIARTFGNRTTECEMLNRSGELYIKKNDFAKGKEYIERSLSISRELGFPEAEASALFNLAKISLLEENKRSALENAENARVIYKSLASPKWKKVNKFIESLNA